MTQLERARQLVVVSAWWTLGQMEALGVSFDEFIELATSKDTRQRDRAEVLWDELTRRLNEATASALEKYPESVLTPEARAFIEALVTGSFRKNAK